MNVFQKLKSRFRGSRTPPPPSPKASVAQPLREFVYLDEVSLRSLLSSQTGEVTDTTSEQRMDALEAQLASAVGVNTPVAKAEVTSSFRTSNSNTLQTSRKATVQSWFREFHSVPNLRLVEPDHDIPECSDLEDLQAIADSSIIIAASALERGKLVEFRVKLGIDPVFHIGTIVSEFSDIVSASPELFAGQSVMLTIGEAQRVNNVLQRMLAGLIPIRAEAIDYAVVDIEGVEYVASRKILEGLQLPWRPLEIVGVTEHIAYWKDIRRVLFSDAEFTMLCRVSRSALYESWAPVKGAQLFHAVAPDLADQLNAASIETFAGKAAGSKSINSNELALKNALNFYKALLLAESQMTLAPDQEAEVAGVIGELQVRAATVTDQRSAFAVVHDLIVNAVGLKIEPSRDLVLRDRARDACGLPLFPSLSNNATTVVEEGDSLEARLKPRLLDVEVIAIYW